MDTARTLAQEAPAETPQAQAARFLRALHASGDWFELRAFKCPDKPGGKYKSTASAYHDDPEAAAADALKLDALKSPGVFVTINPVNDSCNARAYRRIKHPAESTTRGEEVSRRRCLLIDVDAGQPTDVSSTDAERARALAMAERIRDSLAAAGWPAPVHCTTPNGAHLLYRVDLPNDPDVTDLVRRVLAGLADKFNDLPAHVDLAVFDPNRIGRIPGTTGRKGDSTPERPHRRGELLEVPEELVPVPRELLEAIAAPKPAATPARAPAPRTVHQTLADSVKEFYRVEPTAASVRGYLEHFGVTIKGERDKGGYNFFDLECCPITNTASDNRTDISVSVGADRIAYHNKHNRGEGLTWPDLREHYEPGYREHSARMKDRKEAGNALPSRATTAPAASAAAGPDDPEEWEEPIPLDGAAVLPPFPLDALPAHVAGFVRELAASLEVCPDMPAAFALGVGAASCQGKFRVHVRADHWEPLNLFIAVALPPAEMKSESIRQAVTPLDAYQEELQERERANVAQAAERHHVETERRKELRSEAARAKTERERDAAARELEGLAVNDDEPPTLPRLTASGDILPEVLAKILNQQGGRLALTDAEGGVFFGNFAGRYSSGKPNFEILLKAHAGDDVIVDRQSKPGIIVRRPCLTVILAVQPDVVRRLADTPQFRERGLAGRFLFSFPQPMAGRREFNGPPVSDAARALYGFGIRAALDLPAERGADSREVARELTLSPDALEVFQQMARAVGAQMRDGGELHGIQDWAGKAHGAAARVAGVLHVLEHSAHGPNYVNSVNSVLRGVSKEKRFFFSSFESSCTCEGDPGAVPVSTASVAHAWQIVTYYKAHALHAYSLMGADTATEQARRILAWIREKMLKRFTQRDCHRRFQADALTASTLNTPLSLLEDRHYIRREPDPERTGTRRGRKPSPTFTVNPLWQN